MNQPPRLYTIKNAARALGVQYRQLLESVNSAEIPHYKIQKSRRLVDLNDVLDVMRHDGKNEA